MNEPLDQGAALNAKLRELGVLDTTPPQCLAKSSTRAAKQSEPPEASGGAPQAGFDPRHVVEHLGIWWLLGKDRYFQMRGPDAPVIILAEKDVKRELRLEGISSRVSEGMTHSRGDVVMRYIQRNRHVDWAGTVAGKRIGIIEEQGRRILVTTSYTLIDPAPGGWPTLRRIFEGLFITEGVDQTPWVYAWLKTAVEALRKGKTRPGHALIMAGPSDCGKSFLQQHVLTPLLGGRPPADPTKHLLNKTNFNSDLAAAEHLAIQELPSGLDFKSRVLFSEELKRLVATENHSVVAKYGDALTLYPWWRVSISVNDSPDRLRSLPPLSSDFGDKVLLLLCKSCPENFPGPDEDERADFRRRIKSEFPAFVDFLLSWEIPSELMQSKHASRFGHDHFHHPHLASSLFEQESESALLYILDECIELYADGSWGWKSAEALQEQLLENPRFGTQARKLFGFHNACGSYLGKLKAKFPKRFLTKHTNRGNVWLIHAPPE